ncbi:MAG: succinate dehydrogenase assembly factor 2 [Pseudomonadota bacterium]|nr:succinate dehydrogenase assembly factor 2 [Pseudomonadota bacterium]
MFARLQFRCRRGMLELDEIFERFLASGITQLNAEQLILFDRLLDEPDPVLLDWLTGRDRPTDEAIFTVVQQIRQT